MHVGVLAFHGDFAEHLELLRKLNVSHGEVRSVDHLKKCTHLIIPGGESTVMAKFLRESGVGKEIQNRAKRKNLAIYGTCAGAILLASRTTGKNAPKPLKLIDITVDRNAYGTQTNSFEAALKVKGCMKPVRASFIRAPKITRISKDVTVLSSIGKEPVLVQSGNILAGTFHPEVRGSESIHHLLLSL